MWAFLLLSACADNKSAKELDEPAYLCADDISLSNSALTEYRKVIQFYFRYGENFHTLVLDHAKIGYNFGPNTNFSSGGYRYDLESSSGELLQSFTDEVPIRIYMEDTGCEMKKPEDADFYIGFDFMEPEANLLRVTDLGYEISCGGDLYQGSGEELLKIDFSPCKEVLCANQYASEDPWCL